MKAATKMSLQEDTRSQESRVRRKAQRYGYIVRKSRRAQSIDNFGEFALIEASRNLLVLGPRFNASLDDIEAFLDGDGS